MLLPLVVWAAARFLAFGDVTGGRLESLAAPIATGLAVWPTGIVLAGFPAELGSSFPSGRSEIISAVFLAANAGLWIFVLYAALTTARPHLQLAPRTELTASLLVWTLGALSFGVMMGHHARYGGSYYPFLYLFLAAFLFSPAYRVPRWAAASVLLVFSAVTIVQAGRSARLALVWQSFIAPERALHDALRALPQDGRTVYVVNAAPGFASAPHHLNRAWSLNLNVVIVNQFDRCATSSDAGTTQVLDSGAGLFRVQIPDCAVFKFGAANPQVLRAGIREPLQRNGVGTYRFPDGIAESRHSLELGRSMMLLQIDPKTAGLTLIAYNWDSAEYGVIRY